jgi:hypothetical protein
MWACAFGLASFYWASGGTLGLETVGVADLGRHPWFIAITWVTGALKVLAGFMALSLGQSKWKAFPLWLSVTATWGAGILFFLYGAANLVVRLLMAVRVIPTPESMRSLAGFWHLVLWDPWWLLGGILFLATAWIHRKQKHRYP